MVLWRLAVHPSQPTCGSDYLEMSISYVATASGVSLGTAHTAWHIARGLLDWTRIGIAEARDRGIALRKLSRGQRYGQHLIVPRETRSEARRALPVVREAISDLLPSEDFSEAPDAGWRPLRVVGRRAAICPFHDDRSPSMIWNPDAGGRTGVAVCMVCRDARGRNLCAIVQKTSDGFRARLSRKTLLASEAPSPRCLSRIERIQVSRSEASSEDAPETSNEALDPNRIRSTWRTGSIVLGSLDRYGNARRASKSSDLLSVLRYAERTSTDAGEVKAWTAKARAEQRDEDPRDLFPDSLVSVSEMAPRSFEARRFGDRTVAVPSSWRAVAQRWILFDLDGLEAAPRTRDEVEALRSAVSEVASSDRMFSGRFAIVRTSSRGVQVWLSLSRVVDPGALSRNPAVRAWYRGVGKTLLEAAGNGGTIDLSALGVGRFGRRPGWRIDRDGIPYRARLIAFEDGPRVSI